jgi:non-specific protein-tyrosine kinase
LSSLVSVHVVRNTHLLQIAVTSANPVLARDIANTLANDFIQDSEAQQLGSIADAQKALKQQIADVNAQMRNTAARLDQIIGSQSIETAQLQFNLTQEQTTYWELQRSLTDLQLNETRILDLAQVVEPAITPALPIAPLVRRDTLTGAALGLLVGLGAAFVLEYLDDTVKSSEDVQQASGLSPLGIVLRQRPGPDSVLLVTSHNPRSQFAEGYRILRTNVDFARVDHPGNALLITSPGQGEGKSTTLVNLAVVLAESGRTVLAIDADLRRPSVHQAFGIENSVGLTSMLLDDEPQLALAVKETRIGSVRVIPSGSLPPNPAELLGSNRMRRLLERLRREADVVLLDSPPVLAVTDATVLAAMADGVILVAAAGQTRIDELTRARQVLAQGPVHVLGVILNKVGNRPGGYYYRHYYASDNVAANGAVRTFWPLKPFRKSPRVP